MSGTALLLIDLQNDYFPGGRMALEGSPAAVAANDHGYRVTLLADACATRAQKFGDETVPARHVHAAFLAALEGAYAKVVATDEFLKTLPEST